VKEKINILIEELTKTIIEEVKKDLFDMVKGLNTSVLKKQYYNLKELEQITGITHRALKARIKRGTLQAKRDGNIYLIPADEVKRVFEIE
jgi:hypothetical protein